MRKIFPLSLSLSLSLLFFVPCGNILASITDNLLAAIAAKYPPTIPQPQFGDPNHAIYRVLFHGQPPVVDGGVFYVDFSTDLHLPIIEAGQVSKKFGPVVGHLDGRWTFNLPIPAPPFAYTTQFYPIVALSFVNITFNDGSFLQLNPRSIVTLTNAPGLGTDCLFTFITGDGGVLVQETAGKGRFANQVGELSWHVGSNYNLTTGFFDSPGIGIISMFTPQCQSPVCPCP